MVYLKTSDFLDNNFYVGVNFDYLNHPPLLTFVFQFNHPTRDLLKTDALDVFFEEFAIRDRETGDIKTYGRGEVWKWVNDRQLFIDWILTRVMFSDWFLFGTCPVHPALRQGIEKFEPGVQELTSRVFKSYINDWRVAAAYAAGGSLIAKKPVRRMQPAFQDAWRLTLLTYLFETHLISVLEAGGVDVRWHADRPTVNIYPHHLMEELDYILQKADKNRLKDKKEIPMYTAYSIYDDFVRDVAQPPILDKLKQGIYVVGLATLHGSLAAPLFLFVDQAKIFRVVTRAHIGVWLFSAAYGIMLLLSMDGQTGFQYIVNDRYHLRIRGYVVFMIWSIIWFAIYVRLQWDPPEGYWRAKFENWVVQTDKLAKRTGQGLNRLAWGDERPQGWPDEELFIPDESRLVLRPRDPDERDWRISIWQRR